MTDLSAFEPLVKQQAGRKIAAGSLLGRVIETATIGGQTHGSFAIGSLTKVFTALLAADASFRNEVRLDDPVGQWLPEISPDDPSVCELSLLALASHSSGLPREAPSLIAQFDRGDLDLDNPFANFTETDLLDALRHVRLGSRTFEYSNFAYMLMGLVLQRITRQTFRDLVSTRICEPLEMRQTFVRNGQDQVPLEQGHDHVGRVVPFWDEPLPGPGSIYSTAEDLCRFLVGACDEGGALAHAFNVLRHPRVDVGSGNPPSTRVGLAWFISEVASSTWLWHGGSAGGVHAFMAVDPDRSRGLVALANWFEASRPVGSVASALLGIAP